MGMFDQFTNSFSKAMNVQLEHSIFWILAIALVFTLTAIHYIATNGPGKASLAKIFRSAFPKEDYNYKEVKLDGTAFLILDFLLSPLQKALMTVLSVVEIGEVISGKLGPGPAVFDSTLAIVAVQFLGLLLTGEFWFYWTHRWSHRIPVLWGGHKAHHSAERMNIFVARRGGLGGFIEGLMLAPFSALFNGITSAFILYFTGGKLLPETMASLTFFGVYVGYFIALYQHMSVPISFGKLDYIIISPATHRIHHSAELRHRDLNFGGFLSIFDRMFGTLYIPKAGETYRLGLNEEEIGDKNPHKTATGFYLEPVVFTVRQIRILVVQWVDRFRSTLRNLYKMQRGS